MYDRLFFRIVRKQFHLHRGSHQESWTPRILPIRHCPGPFDTDLTYHTIAVNIAHIAIIFWQTAARICRAEAISTNPTDLDNATEVLHLLGHDENLNPSFRDHAATHLSSFGLNGHLSRK